MLELIQRSNVESFIGNNIEVLEEIVNERAQRYLRLQREKEKYDFGQRLTPKKLSELAGEVIRETNGFLGISDPPPANLSMFYLPEELKYGVRVALGVFTLGTLVELGDGLTTKDLQTAGLFGLIFGAGVIIHGLKDHADSTFFPYQKTIRIAERRTVPTIGAIAHEYTHHLQYATQLSNQRKNPIVEGHARGVEGIVTALFAQKYDNWAYAFDHAERIAKETKDAYLFVCEQRGINLRPALANLPIPNIRGFLYNLLGHHYSIGVAAMSIAERKYGNKVYRDVLKNDFSFLKSIATTTLQIALVSTPPV